MSWGEDESNFCEEWRNGGLWKEGTVSRKLAFSSILWKYMTCENALPFLACIHITHSDCTSLSVNFLLLFLPLTHTHTHTLKDWPIRAFYRKKGEKKRKHARKRTTLRRPWPPHHGPCHKRFLSPGPARLPWVGCQATEATLTCAGERESRGYLSVVEWKQARQHQCEATAPFAASPPPFSSSVSLLQPSSFPAQLDRNTRSAAGAEERICWVTDRVEQAGASTASAEVVFFLFSFKKDWKRWEISKSAIVFHCWGV